MHCPSPWSIECRPTNASRDPATQPWPECLDPTAVSSPPQLTCSGPLRDLHFFPATVEAEQSPVDKWRPPALDRKSTRLNSSHSQISYAVFCLKKKKKKTNNSITQQTLSLI